MGRGGMEYQVLAVCGVFAVCAVWGSYSQY